MYRQTGRIISVHSEGWSLQHYSLNTSAAQLQQDLARSGPAGSAQSVWAAVWCTLLSIQILDKAAGLRMSLTRPLRQGRSWYPDKRSKSCSVWLCCKQQLTAMLPASLNGCCATGHPACLCQHELWILAGVLSHTISAFDGPAQRGLVQCPPPAGPPGHHAAVRPGTVSARLLLRPAPDCRPPPSALPIWLAWAAASPTSAGQRRHVSNALLRTGIYRVRRKM